MAPRAYYLQPSCIPNPSGTSIPQTQFIVMAVPSPVLTPDPTAPATSIDIADATPPASALPIEIVLVIGSLFGAISFLAMRARRLS